MAKKKKKAKKSLLRAYRGLKQFPIQHFDEVENRLLRAYRGLKQNLNPSSPLGLRVYYVPIGD